MELKYLAPYLPYKLKVKSFSIFEGDPIFEMGVASNNRKNIASISWVMEDNFKPILRPLSDLSKKIYYEIWEKERILIKDHNIVMQLSEDDFNRGKLDTYYHKDVMENYELLQVLLELHYDVFGLIPKGLAVDINTLKQ